MISGLHHNQFNNVSQLINACDAVLCVLNDIEFEIMCNFQVLS